MKEGINKTTMLEFNSGKQAAFTAVFKFFFQPLCYFAFKIIKNEEEAKDIVITMLNNVMQQHSMFTEFHKLQGYLYTAVANRCKNFLKTKRLLLTDAIDGNDYPTDNDADNLAIKTELLRLVLAEVNQLKPVRKKIFELHFLQGKTVTEIQKLLNLKRTTVSMHKERGIEKIQQLLKLKRQTDEIF